MSSPSEYARSQVGKTMLYGTDRREVIIEDVRLSGSTVKNINTGREWPGIQFKMRPTDGGRAFWSTTFADRRPEDA